MTKKIEVILEVGLSWEGMSQVFVRTTKDNKIIAVIFEGGYEDCIKFVENY